MLPFHSITQLHNQWLGRYYPEIIKIYILEISSSFISRNMRSLADGSPSGVSVMFVTLCDGSIRVPQVYDRSVEEDSKSLSDAGVEP